MSRVVVLLGAGASVDAGLPTAVGLTESVVAYVRAIATTPEAGALTRAPQLIDELAGGLQGPIDIELFMDCLRLLGDRQLSPLLAARLHGYGEVAEALVQHLLDRLEYFLPHAAPGDRSYLGNLAAFAEADGLDVFTLNYDRLVEAALHDRRVPFTTGFPEGRIWHDGNFEEFPRVWDVREFDKPVVRLHKLHGSCGWRFSAGFGCCEEPGIAALDESWSRREPMSATEIAASPLERSVIVFGTREKYVPFEPLSFLWQRFERLILEAEVLVVVGYSGRDELVNRVIFDEASQRPYGRYLRVITVSPSAPPWTRTGGSAYDYDFAYDHQYCGASARTALNQGLISQFLADPTLSSPVAFARASTAAGARRRRRRRSSRREGQE